MTPEELEDLEKTYREVSLGGDLQPTLGLFNCEVCQRDYIIPHDEPCEHLRKLLDDAKSKKD